LGPRANVIKLFYSKFTNFRTKLECFRYEENEVFRIRPLYFDLLRV
jgi:hypothetical protein